MSFPAQIRIPANYKRGGTSKGVFFSLDDLPLEAQQPGIKRDALLLRVIGSPDAYGKHYGVFKRVGARPRSLAARSAWATRPG